MGREEGFAEWYLACYGRILRPLVVITRNIDEARECTDEAFARALERWSYVHKMGSPSGWVCRTAINVARRRARRAALEATLLARYPPRSWVPPDDVDLDLWAAVASLPPRQRIAVALRYVGDLPESEIAHIMGVTVGTISATLHAARNRLMKDLGVLELETCDDGP